MSTLQKFVQANIVKTLKSNHSETLKGGGITNGKNGCPVGYEPNDPFKFMQKMAKMEAK